MGILNSNTSISKDKIQCADTFDITFSLTASPDLKSTPKEIVLVLDKSGSMNGRPFEELKKAALKFIDIIDVESDGKDDERIGSENKIGLVSFDTTAAIDSQLTDLTSILINKINVMKTNSGSTNHKDAFEKAIQVLSKPSGKEKIIILFTDGVSNTGSEGFDSAQRAKDMGITIYCIGYKRNNTIDLKAFDKWASSPSSAYTYITPDAAELEKIFTSLVQNIGRPGAENISLTDKINSCFEIVKTVSISKGTVNITVPDVIQWNIPSLGMTAHESATCTFTVRQKGICKGDIPVIVSSDYKDSHNNIVTMKSPVINVDCGGIHMVAEVCPKTVDITMDSCVDTIRQNIGDVMIVSQGRIIQVDLKLKGICPGKEVAVAVLLYEKDKNGNEISRGMKTVLVPPHSGTTCADIELSCINFVVPELQNAGSDTICKERKFGVKALANYTSSDFTCCK